MNRLSVPYRTHRSDCLKIRMALLDFSLFLTLPHIGRQMTQPIPPLIPLCSICHKPVELETSKTDHNGKAVHEECYSAGFSQQKPPADN